MFADLPVAGDDTAPRGFSALIRELLAHLWNRREGASLPRGLRAWHCFVLVCVLNAWEGAECNLSVCAFGIRLTSVSGTLGEFLCFF